MNNDKTSRVYWAVLLLCGALFYVMNFFTPLDHDDFAYCFYYAADSSIVRPSSTPITSVWQILPSMWHHYLVVNGRFSTHVIVQLFCGILGKGAFNVANALVFMLLIDLITRVGVGRRSVTWLLLNYLTAMIVFPYQGATMLWLAGAVNYMWPATFTLLLLSKIPKWSTEPTRKWKHAAVFLVAMAVGNMQESISLGVTAGMVVYFFLNRAVFKGYNRTLFVGYLLGALFIVLSPGLSHRVETEMYIGGSMMQMLFVNTYLVVISFFHTVIPVLVLTAFVILCFKRTLVSDVKSNVYVLSFIMILLFVFALGMPHMRIQYGMCVLGYVFLLQCVERFLPRIPYEKAVCAMLMLCVAALSCFVIKITMRAGRETKVNVQRVLNAPQDCVIKDEMPVTPGRYCSFHKFDSNRFDFHNRVKSFYYHKNFIQALPEEIYDFYQNPQMLSSLKREHILSSDTAMVSEAYALPAAKGDYMVMPIKGDLPMNYNLKVECIHNIDGMSLHERIWKYKNGAVEGKTKETCTPIIVKPDTFLIVSRPSDARRFLIESTAGTISITME